LQKEEKKKDWGGGEGRVWFQHGSNQGVLAGAANKEACKKKVKGTFPLTPLRKRACKKEVENIKSCCKCQS